MAIEFRCNQCGQLLRVPDDSAGKKARCPKCQAMMAIPGTLPSEVMSPPQFPATAVSTPSPAASEPLESPPTPAVTSPASTSNPFGELGAVAATGATSVGSAADDPAGSPAVPGAMDASPYTNPYAHSFQLQPTAIPDDPRPGLPWEAKSQSFGSWWETSKLIMFSPSEAYAEMRQTGGIARPMIFALLGSAIGGAGQLFWTILFTILHLVINAANNAPAEQNGTAIFLGFIHVMSIISNVVGGATIGIMISAGIFHLCLMLVKGANANYECTFRVLSYAHGSLSWIHWIPCCGGLVITFWIPVAGAIGAAVAHKTTITKSLLAMFLPTMVCGGLAVILLVVGIAIASLAN